MGRKPTPQPLMLPESTSASLNREHNSTAETATVQATGLSSADAASASSQRSFPLNRPYTARSPVPPNEQEHHNRHLRDDHSHPQSSHANIDSIAGTSPEASRQPVTEGRKASRSAFFHFSKGSRVATQPLPTTQPLLDKQDNSATRSGDHLATDQPSGMCLLWPAVANYSLRRTTLTAGYSLPYHCVPFQITNIPPFCASLL